MKTNIIRLSLLVAIVAGALSFSFRPMAPTATKYMYITVCEPVIGGEAGDSRIIVTDASGNSLGKFRVTFPLSLANFSPKNIQENDSALVKLLNKYAKDGWKVKSVAVYDQAYVTKYLLTKN